MKQILIDTSVIELYVKGTDEDRKVIDKLYGKWFSEFRDGLIFNVFNECLKSGISSFPVVWRGETMTIEINIKKP